MTAIIAQAPESFGLSVVQALSHNGLWVFLAVCVLAATAKHLVHMILKHQERLAMIQAGMAPKPDTPTYPVGYADRSEKRAG